MNATATAGTLQDALTEAAAARPVLVPYVTGGITHDWTDCLSAYAAAGADAIEIGLPFSDPMLEGPVIQAASQRALDRGATPRSLLAEIGRHDVGVPLVVMTYTNVVVRAGLDRFCASLREAGVGGLAVPDTPWAEVGPLSAAAVAAGIDLVLLVAPSTPPARQREIAARTRGFLYAVSRLGTTGERAELSTEVAGLTAGLRPHARTPVLVGFGLSTPEHAVRATRTSDGVVVGSALMRRALDGATPADLGAEVSRWRAALDDAGRPAPEVTAR